MGKISFTVQRKALKVGLSCSFTDLAGLVIAASSEFPDPEALGREERRGPV